MCMYGGGGVESMDFSMMLVADDLCLLLSICHDVMVTLCLC